MKLKMICDICGEKITEENLGYVLNPITDWIKPIQRCKKCHRIIRLKNKKEKKKPHGWKDINQNSKTLDILDTKKL